VIIIRVRDQTGEESFFGLDAASQKVVYAAGAIVNACSREASSLLLRFRLDGQVIDGDDTLRTLGMEDIGMIDCMLEQTGC
jgi:hypothetical protein